VHRGRLTSASNFWCSVPAFRSPDPQCLVHGDFKLDNLVWERGQPRVAAVLDWEMCAAGHPMADLANLAMVFASPR